MYEFMSIFLSKNSPARPLSTVNVVSGDGFFDQDMVTKLGFVLAKFITDIWHLKDSGLDKLFGKAGHEMLKSHLIRMIDAKSEKEFEDVHLAAQELLKAMPARNGQLEQTLEDFASRRETYAQYCLDKIPGNRGLHGNAASESNHSSALCFLNDGNKKGNTFCKHPIVLIRELLKRQKKHVNKVNARLFGESQKLVAERHRLANLPATESNNDLRRAAAALNLNTYDRYKKFQRRAQDDLYLKEFLDPQTQGQYWEVGSLRHSDAPPRRFCNTSDRCNCVERVAEQGVPMRSRHIKASIHPFLSLDTCFVSVSRDHSKGGLKIPHQLLITFLIMKLSQSVSPRWRQMDLVTLRREQPDLQMIR